MANEDERELEELQNEEKEARKKHEKVLESKHLAELREVRLSAEFLLRNARKFVEDTLQTLEKLEKWENVAATTQHFQVTLDIVREGGQVITKNLENFLSDAPETSTEKEEN